MHDSYEPQDLKDRRRYAISEYLLSIDTIILWNKIDREKNLLVVEFDTTI